MARHPRWVPEGGALVEITCRTIQSRYLLRPSRRLNEIVVGVFARAQCLYPVELSGLVVTSSHYHALAWMPNVQRQAELLRHLNTNLSKEVGRLVDWSHQLWARRYDPVVVSDEERAQLARLRYLLSNGVKEALVERVHEWPGVHCGEALRTGEPLKGYWFNRTKEYAARRRGKEYGVYDFAEEAHLAFDKLPCWKHLSDEEYRARIAEMIEEIEREYARVRETSGRTVLGVDQILKVHPHQRPSKTKRSRRPPFHAATKQKLKELREAFNAFLVAFYDAVGKLRDGDPDPPFPDGCFRPPMLYAAPTRGP